MSSAKRAYSTYVYLPHRVTALARSSIAAVHLREVDVAEQWGDHVTLSNAALARRLQDQLQDTEPVTVGIH